MLCLPSLLALTLAAPGDEPWLDSLLAAPYDVAQPAGPAVLQLVRQDYERLQRNRSVVDTPLTIGSRTFQRGLGTHSIGHLRVWSPEPLARFTAWIGVDQNPRSPGGTVVFSVLAGRRELFRSGVLRAGQEPQRIELELKGARVLDLLVGDAGDGPACDHADWCDAALTTRSGKTLWLDELPEGTVPATRGRYPFSFTYDGRPSDDLLPTWRREQTDADVEAGRRVTTTFTDPATGLRLTWEATRFADFPALDQVLRLENTGAADTPIIEDLQAADLVIPSDAPAPVGWRLHRTKGAPADPTDFQVAVESLSTPRTLAAAGGRSSNRDFPFFKLEAPNASTIVAVGWSGQWQATVGGAGDELPLVCGQELTHFRLHPGERVRTPRVLLLRAPGDTWNANAQFRQLLHRHYRARREGRIPLPMLFCNTCFTRGGGWLNECDAANQISLIRAYQPLGLEALLTDAGWFEGGWPSGAGNWTPRHDAYPDGMRPVAAAAREHGMVYGLWFEPERVVAGTQVHRQHPDWCLAAGPGPQGTYLLNFGLPAVQEHFFGIVKGFMDLRGFRFYRQDFNMDPLAFWRFNDAEDRQGVTEMHYVEGLYAYWDRIAAAWPDSVREECASGGRRIDLETVMRLHLHQKTDYWFDDEVDQASLWALSQYLPNGTVVAHLNRLDDYSFASDLPSALCLGWIADAPGFDQARAKRYSDQYRELRPLLDGAWYPLTDSNRDRHEWLGCQYHRADLDEGLLTVYRRADSPYRVLETRLRGLRAEASYELTWLGTDERRTVRGEELMRQMAAWREHGFPYHAFDLSHLADPQQASAPRPPPGERADTARRAGAATGRPAGRRSPAPAWCGRSPWSSSP
ncbi:MAG: alpha-galactosidase [Armatimonadetes bacterium]|nr:alpha-galactosidase [Armatimonadota bacterium]